MGVAIVLQAPAKLNLTLEVVERLATGYHNLRSVFLRLDTLADTIELRIDETGEGIFISTDSNDIPVDAANICHQAVTRFLRAIGAVARVDIHISKQIPVAAGLGGGSSDAAAVLLGLNRHFDNPIAPAALGVIAAEIGKDVVFFLTGATAALVSGMGEMVEPLTVVPQLHFLLVNPQIAVSTREAYHALRQSVPFMDDPARANISAAMARALERGKSASIDAAFYNDFESHVEDRHPVVKELKQALIAFGAQASLMSGSGPTVFGLFASGASAHMAEPALRRHYPDFVIRIASTAA